MTDQNGAAHDRAAGEIGYKMITDVETQIGRTDAKASAVFGALSFLGFLAGLYISLQVSGVVGGLIAKVAMGCFVGALLCALVAVYPRTKGTPEVLGVSETMQNLRDRAQTAQLELAWVSAQLVGRSKALQKKYPWIKGCCGMLGAGAILILVAFMFA